MPEIIIGPPGTGKTTTLLNMVEEELAAKTQPEHIGFVTFTRKGATEARDRAIAKFNLDKDQFLWFRTLHSLCFRALGMTSADVLEGQKMKEFAEWIGVPITTKGRTEEDEGRLFGNERGDRILQMEHKARVRNVSLREQYDSDSDDLSWWEVERVAHGLQEYKRAHTLYDFNDMLDMFVRQEWTPSLEVLFVDEAQDLSAIQWRVVEKLGRNCRRIVIAGDDDQAIYNWAGAAVDHFVDMQGDVRVLGQSWRVPKSVQRVADGIIGRVKHRRSKEWSPRDEEGIVRQIGLRDIDFSGESILVLGRNALYLNDVQKRLHSMGYMYERNGHPSISNKRRNQLVTWERILRRGEAATVADVRKVYEEMSSGVGIKRGFKELRHLAPDQLVTLADLKQSGGLLRDDVWHDALDRIPLVEREYIRACLRRGEKMSASPRIRLSTIHGSKGGEADEVVLLTDMATRTYREALEDPESEARVWYVAVTRARKILTIVRPATDKHFTIRSW